MGKDTNSLVTNWTHNTASGGAAKHGYCPGDWEIKSDLWYLGGSNTTPPFGEFGEELTWARCSFMKYLYYSNQIQLNKLELSVGIPSTKKLHCVLRKHFLKISISSSSCLKYLTLNFELALWEGAGLKSRSSGDHGFHLQLCSFPMHEMLYVGKSVLTPLELFKLGFWGSRALQQPDFGNQERANFVRSFPCTGGAHVNPGTLNHWEISRREQAALGQVRSSAWLTASSVLLPVSRHVPHSHHPQYIKSASVHLQLCLQYPSPKWYLIPISLPGRWGAVDQCNQCPPFLCLAGEIYL